MECDGKVSCKPACKSRLQIDLFIAHQICLAPGFRGISGVCPLYYPISIVPRIGGLHWWADSPMQFTVGYTGFRARPISSPQDVKVVLALQESDGFRRASLTKLRWDLGIVFNNCMAWSHVGGILFHLEQSHLAFLVTFVAVGYNSRAW
jgi:hypothetical protein